MKRDTARAILITRDGKISLIFRRKQGREYFATPGGGIDEGETPLQAVIREAEEETGTKLKPDDCHEVLLVESEKGAAHFFICYESDERGHPSGDEMRNIDPDNYYEIVERNLAEVKDMEIVPPCIKGYIADNIDLILSRSR